MFVLLEHDTANKERVPAPCSRELHWDLLIEVPGQELLPTWRLVRNPVAAASAVPAQRIQDHRRLFLDYEGGLSGGQGQVRRIDRGPATVEQLDPEILVVVLDGQRLRGRFEIARTRGGQTIFRRVGKSCQWHRNWEGEAPAEP